MLREWRSVSVSSTLFSVVFWCVVTYRNRFMVFFLLALSISLVHPTRNTKSNPNILWEWVAGRVMVYIMSITPHSKLSVEDRHRQAFIIQICLGRAIWIHPRSYIMSNSAIQGITALVYVISTMVILLFSSVWLSLAAFLRGYLSGPIQTLPSVASYDTLESDIGGFLSPDHKPRPLTLHGTAYYISEVIFCFHHSFSPFYN